MAGTGMALRRGTNHGPSDGGDDVQSSIELLDRVLSEFDDVENANQVQNIQQIVAPTTGGVVVMDTTRNPVPVAVTNNVSTTPEDESPSLGGHQSEDDGYMSMNGRKAKFSLSFKPVTEAAAHQEFTSSLSSNGGGELHEFPPPPEEAERLIATLLPRVSPANSAKRNNGRRTRMITTTTRQQPITSIPVRQQQRNYVNIEEQIINGQLTPRHTATQTTFPKTRHQRPYGWETQETNNFRLYPAPPPPGYRYGSLPFTHGVQPPPITSPIRVPPRTVPTVVERHREVRRRNSEDNLSSDLEETTIGLRPLSELADDERFSDDSLEEMLPPPPPVCNKRSSIAWEVPLDQDPLLTPGSTKVVGRRRRRSGENSHSSTSSIPNRLKDVDDWPEPPPCNTEDEIASPFSDSDDPVILPEELRTADLNGSGTYVIRRGRRERKPISGSVNSNSSLNSRLSSDLSLAHSRLSTDLNSRLSRELCTPNSRYSIDLSTPQSRLSPKSRYSLDLNNSNSDFSSNCSTPLQIKEPKKHSTTFDNIKSLMREGVIETYEPNVEVATDFISPKSPLIRVVSLPTLSVEEFNPRRELAVTVEEEEDVESPRQNSAEISPLRKIERNISELLERRDMDDIFANILKKDDLPKRTGIQKSESAKEMLLSSHYSSADFPVKVEIVQHDFPPLPPSPVEEDEDEYSEILHPIQLKTRADTLPVMSSECQEQPPAVPSHREHSSLRTRSMDGGVTRGKRNNLLNTSSRMGATERRTLPMDLPGGTKRRTFNSKRTCQSPRDEQQSHMQTSCSLPETPIFARGCDIPRTPHRRAPDVPGHRTAPRQSSTMGTLNTIGNMSTGSSYRRGLSNSNLEQAIAGAELLRMAGGPGRGWYPRHRHPRPASIEHLDRLTSSNPWDTGSRKPLTLPPNLTPKFFQKSPREALRRVTSLLIRKGNNGKESKKEKEQIPPISNSSNCEEGQKKKGFFKNLWKRSRHYSLEQQ